MNTNRLLFLFLVAALLLSACSGDPLRSGVKLAAEAAYSEAAPAGVQALQLSPRVSACDISTRQLLINAVRAEASSATIGSWLDGKMVTHSCIAK